MKEPKLSYYISFLSQHVNCSKRQCSHFDVKAIRRWFFWKPWRNVFLGIRFDPLYVHCFQHVSRKKYRYIAGKNLSTSATSICVNYLLMIGCATFRPLNFVLKSRCYTKYCHISMSSFLWVYKIYVTWSTFFGYNILKLDWFEQTYHIKMNNFQFDHHL